MLTSKRGLSQPYREEQHPSHSGKRPVGDPHQGACQPSPSERRKGAGSPSQVTGDVGRSLLQHLPSQPQGLMGRQPGQLGGSAT